MKKVFVVLVSVLMLLSAGTAWGKILGLPETGGSIPYLSDCSGIVSGACLDSDDGKLYVWNGSAVVLAVEAVTDPSFTSVSIGGSSALTSVDADLATVSGSDDTIASAKAIGAALDLKQDSGTYPIVVISTGDTDPGVDDDTNGSSTAATPDVSGYSVGDIFVNGTASPVKIWQCSDNTNGAAVWSHLNPETANLPYHQSAYFDPDVVYGRTGARIELDGKTIAALTITEIYVRLGEGADAYNDAEITFTCYQKAAGVDHSSPTTIGSGDTSSGVLTISSFTDATVPANSMIWCVEGDDPDATTIEGVIVVKGTYD
uniref:Uncharacterized protein n=1 Tax=viral metagenome TaxID=1070528 RepID=A0A6M3IKL3_9ZZZZ